MTDAPVVVDAAELRLFARRAFEASGVDAEGAAAGADVLVRTSLRGVQSHGVAYLHQYVRQLRDGGADPRARLVHETDRGGLVAADARAGVGPVVASYATRLGIERAREHGLAMVSVRNANHFGAAGHYALMCAEAGCVGLMASNTPPIMAVTGSRSRSIGNSPLGFGAPRTGAPPFVLDIAMSKVAGGKIRLAAQRGEQVPLGWILDPDGEPSTAPEDFFVERGALLPVEGHKGYGLALMIETLAAALSGAAMASGVGNWLYDPDTPSDTGYFLLVIDVSSESAFALFQDRVRALCEEITAAPRAPGVSRVYVPGEIEALHESRALADGLPLEQEVVERLSALASDLGLRPPPSLLPR
ncbi:MAG: Ldh family oxidoreductase [Streptosporangiales bacterium]|nr:Ldh family oxidoreductase [Streptosporangiales bacterium]